MSSTASRAPSGDPDGVSGNGPRPEAEGSGAQRAGSDPGHGAADRIVLRGLRLVGRHGVLPEERERAQPFEVDLEVEADLSVAGRSDDLAATIDYGALLAAAAAVVEDGHAELLEHLAQRIADAALETAGPAARAVAVTVRKLRPPVPYDLASAEVAIRRANPGR